MMNNLFSTFDPSSSVLSMSWLMFPFIIIFLNIKIMKLGSPLFKLFYLILSILKKEVKFTIKNSNQGTELVIMSLFLFILTMNFVALYPQIFSLTSHLTVTLPLSLSVWLAVIIFGWLNNTSHMLSHLVPQGTPGILMAFMVLIELTSSLIRPITLCVRLTANLIAGHLLMTLLGNSLMTISLPLTVIASMAPIILTVLESAVACIQAYVFMTLVTLYTMEIK